MNFSQDIPENSYFISGYDEQSVRVSNQRFETSFAVHRHGLLTDWDAPSCQQLTTGHFDEILQLNPELVILGTGSSIVFPSIEIRALFLSQGIGFEVMDTHAACRTYNILLSEERNVIAALILGT